ncbi:MAG: S41 family peptidase, partial [Planctomycetota bacterium]
RGVDLDAGLRAIASGLAEEVSVPQLAEDLNGLLMRFGDGHASVSAGRVRETEHLPCLLQEAGEGVVAFLPDRSGFVDPKRPFVQAIDGRSIEEWIEAARPLVSSGSEALVRHRTLRLMREIQRVRRAAGDEPAAGAEVVLSSRSKGGSKKTRTLKLSGRRPTYGPWPRGKTRLLEGRAASGLKGGVGVLRLAEMDDELVPELREAMTRFRNTAGLIVDVRGNGGGRRGLLEALAGYLANDGPVVGNCAAYRLAPGFDRDHLGGARLLYRADDERWSDEQSQAIARFAESFEPEWKLPDGFSEWHYLVLDRTGHRAEYAYTKPVVVLIDAGCFSATDIFAAAMGELPGVTLLGETTSGGSARVQSFELPSTGIRVRCASMASFQPNGRLYDGNGVSPDIEVSSDPADLLRGDSDAQLAAAVKLIAKRTR